MSETTPNYGDLIEFFETSNQAIRATHETSNGTSKVNNVVNPKFWPSSLIPYNFSTQNSQVQGVPQPHCMILKPGPWTESVQQTTTRNTSETRRDKIRSDRMRLDKIRMEKILRMEEMRSNQNQ